VKAFDGVSGAVALDVTPFASSYTGGVRVATLFADADHYADIACATGPGVPPEVRTLSGKTGLSVTGWAGDFTPGVGGGSAGVNLATGNDPPLSPPPVTLTLNLTPSTTNVVATGQSFGVAARATASPGMDTASVWYEWGDTGSTTHAFTYTPAATAGSDTASHKYATANTYTITVHWTTTLAGYDAASIMSTVTVKVEGPPVDLGPDCGLPVNPGGKVPKRADGNVPSGRTSGGVRAADGTVLVTGSDFLGDGFGDAWGQSRSWSNALDYSAGSNNGNGWADDEQPHLELDGSSLALLENADTATYFDGAGTTDSSGFWAGYPARRGRPRTITHDSTDSVFTLTSGDGTVTQFAGFGSSVPAGEQGAFISETAPGGAVTAVISRDTLGRPPEVQRSETVGGVTTTESYLSTYLPDTSANAGALWTVTLRRSTDGGSTWTTVRKVTYDYYAPSEDHGTLGDLKRATVTDSGGSTIDQWYYRYFHAGETGGYAGGMKYAFGPEAYGRLKAAAGGTDADVEAAGDSTVAPYADLAMQYDSSHRVSSLTKSAAGCSACSGGLGTYTYTYSTSSNTPGPNSWATAVTETDANGNTNTYYANSLGEVMLRVYTDTGTSQHWEWFNEYDSNDRLILSAAPSAVTGYNDTYADLLHSVSGNYQYLADSAGLITTFAYASSTTATSSTAGDAAGYQQSVAIQQGETGTSVPQEADTYIKRTAGGVDYFFPAATTQYRNDNGTGGQTTTLSYTWQGSTAQPASITTTLPTVTTAENGPNTATSSTVVFDGDGRPIWQQDAAGFLTYTAYDAATGAVVKQIVDVNTADTTDFADLPSGWSTPTGGGLELISAYQVDALGRVTQATSPGGTVSYVVYNDPQHETLTYPGWNSTTNTPTGPTQVTRDDRADGYTESFTMSATPHLTSGVPDGTEAVRGLQTLTRQYVDSAGPVTSVDVYFDLSGLTYSTGTMGTSGTNYYQTTLGYDADGRQSRVVEPTGTITRTVMDGRGRTVSVWVGTSDTPGSGAWSPTNNTSPANMTDVADYQYDGGGVGDGNLTQVTQHPGGSAADRVTQAWYDWRDRQVAMKQGVSSTETDGVNRPIVVSTYDNLNEVTETQQYAGDGVTPSISGGVLSLPSGTSADLRAQAITSFDELGRAYQAQQYDVNPSSGSVSSTALTTNDYYDSRGNLVAESAPGGLWTKAAFDGAGRKTFEYTTDGAGGTGYSAATSMASDNVLTQTQTAYDGDNNPIEAIASDRFHNATGTGALGTPTTGVHSRVSFAATYYDAADRPTAMVDVGTNGGSSWTRPSSVPTGSSTVLVTADAYNAAGWLQDVTDPLAHVTRTLYDNLGREIKVTQNYTGSAETTTSDVATEFTYDGAGHTLTVKADEPSSGSQTTQFNYGVTVSGGSGVNSNDLLASTEYPDPSTGAASTSQEDTQTVNAFGHVLTKTDRNGTVHTYTYDPLGRQTADAVTTLGTGIDGGVRRIETAYDSQGNPYLITSYNSASGGGVVNQVQRAYNGLGQLITEYQATTGSVNTSTTPKVQYSYVDLASSANNSRPTGMTYPSGYALSDTYGTGLDTTVSRLTSITDSGNTLESFKYLGLGTVVERDHPQPTVNLTYISQTGGTGDAGDQYVGLDRFGRVVDQNWYNTTTSSSVEDVQYGYDVDSNVLWRNDTVNTAFGELYTYDGLNQLASFQRGTLNSSKTGLTGSATASQSWSPDALGNFTNVTTNGTGQSRTVNQQNEITSVSGATAPVFDAAGEMTKDETGLQYVFDAWGRTVAVKSSVGATLESLTYDGLGRQVTSAVSGTTTTFYYSPQGQVVEEWQGRAAQARNVWSLAYVNSLIVRDQSSLHNGTLDQRLYAAQDANWNVTVLVNASGSVVERYAYLPFGAVTVMNSSWGTISASAYGEVYLYQGMRQDAVSACYEALCRWYSPTLATWTKQDPIGFSSGGSNLYEFLCHDPVDYLDPTGLAGASSRTLNTCEKCLIDLFLSPYANGHRMWDKTQQYIATLKSTMLLFGPNPNFGVWSDSFAAGAFQGFAEAITLPSSLAGSGATIHIKPTSYKPCSLGSLLLSSPDALKELIDQLQTVGHELVHAGQIFEATGAGFMLQYGIEYQRLLQLGLSERDAYECISSEREAYAVGNAIKLVLLKQGNAALFAQACCLNDREGRKTIRDALTREFLDEYKIQIADINKACEQKNKNARKK
jgi:RHS repeat-associated protein